MGYAAGVLYMMIGPNATAQEKTLDEVKQEVIRRAGRISPLDFDMEERIL